ncbi:MAG: adenosylcobinamide-GDP ribazoletransferase, partial [Oscillospiraceae bacterium]|nr:adenosylcobinamide-GDP ribazoletransferase [Oscillospiraceae bacterium]
VFIYYRIFSVRRFGGITGDLAGYFLQLCEIWIIAGAVIASLISEVVL